jgi:hypothetical protein
MTDQILNALTVLGLKSLQIHTFPDECECLDSKFALIWREPCIRFNNFCLDLLLSTPKILDLALGLNNDI